MLLQAENLVRLYHSRRGLFARAEQIRAVDNISLALTAGETLGIVGESGSGKSTLGRMLLGIDPVASGRVLFDGKPMPAFGTPEWRKSRKAAQMVWQDPLAALDRRLTIGDQIVEPLDIHAIGTPSERRARAAELMDMVGLRPSQANAFPHEVSGGQRQRIVIARALATQPRLLICDEPVAALDVSVQAQVINLLGTLQKQMRLGMIFISHDLKVVRSLANRIAVVYLGRIVEEGPAAQVLDAPRHPYTQALVSSAMDPRQARDRSQRIVLSGEPPNPARRPSGCAFHPRCPRATALCTTDGPSLCAVAPRQAAACHHVVPS